MTKRTKKTKTKKVKSKSKSKVKTKASKVSTEKPTEEVDLYLTPDENSTLLLCDARIKNAELTKRLKKAEFEIQEANVALQIMQRQNQLKHDLETLDVEKESLRRKMEIKKAEVEERLGIELKNFAYEPETGLLSRLLV